MSSIRIATLAVAALFPAAALAQSVSLPAIDTPYTQQFDTLANTGTSNLLPSGWYLLETGTATAVDQMYAAGTGSGNAGNVYSFGAAGSTERAFGQLLSGTLTPTIGASFTNNTGVTVQSLAISYVGELWRFGATGRGADRLDFQYSTDATSLTTGTWTHFDALDFSTPNLTGTAGARDGNHTDNRTTVTASITGIGLANGATIWIRWQDFNVSNADDGLAVDEFSITPRVDAAPFVTSVEPPNNASDVPRNANIELSFSEAVTLDASGIDLFCVVSGEHAFTLSGSGTSYTIDPVEDFGAGEACTVTIAKGSVSDTDTDDPPDGMSVNFVTGFSTHEECGDPFVFIHDIQGDGMASARVGESVSVEGIVTADYSIATSFQGFYVQEEDDDADANPATSEGIFVFTGNNPFAVQVGDHVRVSGRVTEFSSLTEISQVRNVLVCGQGYDVTEAAVALPVASVSDLERYEGMLVEFAQDLTVSETFSLGRFGEVVLSANGRIPNPTAVAAPGAPALAQQDLNNRSRIVLDDGDDEQNIDPTVFPLGGLSASNTLRVGYTVHDLTGVLEQRFGAYRVQPVGPIAFDATTNPRPAAPAEVGGNVRVASANVLNYFNGDGLGGGFPTDRGANTLPELVRQRAKIVSALAGLDADVVGLLEIENDPIGNSAIEELVGALNAELGEGTYDFIDTGVFGGDLIRSAIIYKPASVTPVGDHKLLDSTVDSRWIERGNRPALAQTFDAVANGARFTVAVNHLRSKGSSCDSTTSPFDDPDIGDGQGNCNKVRTAAATALVDWLSTDPTGSSDPDVLIIGDLNAYAKEDPITAIVGAGYTDLIDAFVGEEAYSYVFQAQTGYLDHALATGHLVSQVSGVTEWHINADEPPVLDYNVEFKTANQVNTFYAPDAFRAADHDPLLVGLELSDEPDEGFLTGGGWIDGPRGPVTFGMTAVYQQDSEYPQGNANVRGQGVSFQSTRFEWLSVLGTTAQLKGRGTLNGRPDLHFLITAVDGAPDRFRLRVWSYDTTGAHTLFDSADRPLRGGSLTVHE